MHQSDLCFSEVGIVTMGVCQLDNFKGTVRARVDFREALCSSQNYMELRAGLQKEAGER